jgi:nicotinate-nucleotide pyrophosphorylase (carboxylating)
MHSFDEQLQILAEAAFKEDIGDGDHSTLSCIPPDKKGKAVLIIKQEAIIAGVEVAKKIFLLRDPGTQIEFYKKDGDQVFKGEKAFEVVCSVYTILQCERIILNCMQRMSGIASLTHQYVDKIKGYRSKILDTRKTTPSFRLLEKEAVRIGGGLNHRFGLTYMIMQKTIILIFAEALKKRSKKHRTTFNPPGEL